MKPLTFGSLFAGIGGMDLGLERAGMECRWQVEIKPFPRRVLSKHWPAVTRFEDIRGICLFDEEGWRLIEVPEYVDVICGGFPCQDISHAGKGIGIVGERSGLWSEFARLVAELRPLAVFAENVPALRNRGLALVLQDLWSIGYDAEWNCIPASAFGAPHERDRIWIVAYATGLFREAVIGRQPDGTLPPYGFDADSIGQRHEGGSVADKRAAGAGLHNAVANIDIEHGYDSRHGASEVLRIGPAETDLSRCEASISHLNRGGCDGRTGKSGTRGRLELENGGTSHANHDSTGCEEQRIGIADGEEQSAAECGNWWAVEPGVVRMVYGVPNRVDRLTGLGNAVVPQVAEWIGRRIIAAHYPESAAQEAAKR